MTNPTEPGCDLCGDTGVLHLGARCHPTAPLRAELHKDVLTLYCYVPECSRTVAKFKISIAGDQNGQAERSH